MSMEIKAFVMVGLYGSEFPDKTLLEHLIDSEALFCATPSLDAPMDDCFVGVVIDLDKSAGLTWDVVDAQSEFKEITGRHGRLSVIAEAS